MANRLLTADEIQSLFACSMVGESFIVDDRDGPVKVTHLGSGLSEVFATMDRILSDADFINNRVKPFKKRIELNQKASEPSSSINSRVPPSLLDERGKTHGDYSKMSTIIQDLKAVVRRGTNWDRLSPGKKEAFELMATKWGRILEGDPDFPDHWDDVAGYANKGKE